MDIYTLEHGHSSPATSSRPDLAGESASLTTESERRVFEWSREMGIVIVALYII